MTGAEGVTWELKRAYSRTLRELAAWVPPVDRVINQRYSRRLSAYRDRLAPLPPQQHRLLEEVTRTGAAVTDLDSLGLPGTASLKEPLERLAAGLAARSPGQHPLCSSQAELLEELSVWQWGLREDVLDLVEGYLQLPARYYGPEVRREVADGRQLTYRKWHRDSEDHRVFKILVWIHDVGPLGGAFEWVPRDLTSTITRRLRYVSGYRPECQVVNVVPPALWRRADGPRWTAVLTDTHNVFHRAGTPRDTDRYSVTFKWTSRWPVKTTPAKRFTPGETATIQQGLNGRQLACLPPELLAR